MTRSNRFQFLDALWASVNRIIAIAGKEFVALLKDKGSRLILVVPVIVQAVLFGYGATFNLERVPWTYYDASHSSSSMDLKKRSHRAQRSSASTSRRILKRTVRCSPPQTPETPRRPALPWAT